MHAQMCVHHALSLFLVPLDSGWETSNYRDGNGRQFSFKTTQVTFKDLVCLYAAALSS